MSSALIESLVDLGVAAVVFGMAFVIFLKIHTQLARDAKDDRKNHREERKEWRESQEKQTEKTVNSLNDLVRNINRMYDE